MTSNEPPPWLARAIVRFGLSEKWGNESIPTDMKFSEYLLSISQKRRALLESEINIILKEARQLTYRALLANFDTHLLPIGSALAAKGILEESDLAEFWQRNEVKKPDSLGLWEKARSTRLGIKLANLWRVKPNREQKIKPSIPKPETIADIEEIIERKRAETINAVPIPKDIPLANHQELALLKRFPPLEISCRGSFK